MVPFFSLQSSRGVRPGVEKAAHELVKGVKRHAPVEVQYVTASKLEAPGMHPTDSQGQGSDVDASMVSSEDCRGLGDGNSYKVISKHFPASGLVL